MSLPTTSNLPSPKGYQKKQSQLHSIQLLNFQYSQINCAIFYISPNLKHSRNDESNNGGNNYIIALTEDSIYDIHVVEFKISENQIEIGKEFSHDLRNVDSFDNSFDSGMIVISLFALQSERSFLIRYKSGGIFNLAKIDIESGQVLWKKQNFPQFAIVEDERGILYSNSIRNNCITLYDTKTGNYLSRISLKLGYIINSSIGFDHENNILVTLSSRDYNPRLGVISKNGKWLKTLPFSSYHCSIKADPYNKETYLSDFPHFKILTLNSGVITTPIDIKAFTFVRNCNFILMVGERDVYLYD